MNTPWGSIRYSDGAVSGGAEYGKKVGKQIQFKTRHTCSCGGNSWAPSLWEASINSRTVWISEFWVSFRKVLSVPQSPNIIRLAVPSSSSRINGCAGDAVTGGAVSNSAIISNASEAWSLNRTLFVLRTGETDVGIDAMADVRILADTGVLARHLTDGCQERARKYYNISNLLTKERFRMWIVMITFANF